MSSQDGDRNKRKNPWARPGDDNRGSSGPSWGGGGTPPPDMEEWIRRAQDNFRSVIPGGPMRTGQLVLIAAVTVLALWAASGFYTVEPGENAVVQRFGAWAYTRDQEGLAYRWPSPIESITKVKVNEIRKLTIGFNRDSSRDLIARQNLPEESLMLTADRNIVDLNLTIQWNIKSAEDFLFNIQDQENTIKKVAESAIREVVGQTEMFPVITNRRKEVADRTKQILQENLDEYRSGVNITEVLIDRAEVHPEVQNAFQDVQSAKQDAENYQNEAGAYREKIIPNARGQAIKITEQAQAYKQANVTRAQGDAQRFTAVYEAYQGGQDVTRERLYIETMEDILGNAQKIILDGKSGSGAVPYLPLDGLRARGKPQAPESGNSLTGGQP
ncbi:MAG: FtsH protease activity modulator HflK [Alphaproteobacteria bacterium]|nr:FtsH protease activity modulator HflK [Alphaproteobacteria bacterium]